MLRRALWRVTRLSGATTWEIHVALPHRGSRGVPCHSDGTARRRLAMDPRHRNETAIFIADFAPHSRAACLCRRRRPATD